MTYVTLDAIEARLGGNVLPEQRTALADELLSACTAIDVHCRQTFTTATSATAKTYRPLNGYTAWVDPFYTTIGLIIQTDTNDDSTFATTWVASDYELDYFGGDWGMSIGAPYDTIRGIASVFPTYARRGRTLQVTAKWGWATCPQNVIEATKVVTLDLWRRKDAPFGSTTGGAHEFGALRLSKSALDAAVPLLEAFVRKDRTVGFG